MKRAVVKVEATQGKRLVALRRAANRAILSGGGDVETLMEMFNIDSDRAQSALRQADGDLERAIAALLFHRTAEDGQRRSNGPGARSFPTT